LNAFRGAWLVARKDLRIEARTGDVVITTALFGVLVTVLVSVSFWVDPLSARRMAPGVIWVTVAFSGVLSMGRSWARERENDVMRALLLSPMPRFSIYLGKALGSLLFMITVELVFVPLAALLFNVDLVPILPELVLLLLLGTIGFVATGTLFSVMGVRTSARDLVLSIVTFPLVTPALLAGVVATRDLMGGATLAEVEGWLRILAAFDILFVAGGALLFDPLARD
jgi:heme exporter protein B